MAQYRCSIKARIGRAKGGSVVRAASYIAREKIDNTRTGETFDFSKHKDGALWVGTFAPQNAPEWARDVSQLANEIEKAEKYKNAQLALPIELSLAHELTLEQNRWMLQDFVKENFTRKGYATIAAIHEPPEHGNSRNIHAHLLVSLRKIDESGFAPTKAEQQKNYLKRRERVEELRQSWEHHLKRHLARHNFVREAEEVSCKSLDAQGIDREATKHLGPVAAHMESEGQQTELGDKNREIEARNKERERLKIEARTVARELAEAEKERREEREKETTEEERKRKIKPKTREPYSQAGMVPMQQDAQREFFKTLKAFRKYHAKQKEKEQKEREQEKQKEKEQEKRRKNPFVGRMTEADKKREEIAARTIMSEAKRNRMVLDSLREKSGENGKQERNQEGGRKRERERE